MTPGVINTTGTRLQTWKPPAAEMLCKAALKEAAARPVTRVDAHWYFWTVMSVILKGKYCLGYRSLRAQRKSHGSTVSPTQVFQEDC